ncbi:MAG: cupin domain-containing protein [Dehalococcoidales bacterium]|nr:cupin domain-containing protein [Dehalococcoidales bacterium]
MAESQYGKYIITEDLMPPMAPEAVKLMEDQAAAGNTLDRTLLLGIQDSILKGAFFVGCEIIWGLTGDGPVTIEAPHTHDFDEIIGFIGTDKSQPRSLNGEIEFWLGGEQHILTETCLIYIPKGLTHCPIYFRKVDTPIAMFESGNGVDYEKVR